MTKQRRISGMEVLGLALGAVLTGSLSAGYAQTGSPTPYAAIKTEDINYNGPGREPAYDLTDATIPIGLVVPLRGPRQAEGAAIVAAAQMALEEATREPLPGGRRLTLALGDESGPSWSATAAALTDLALEKRVVAIITSANGSTAHLSEQVGNRIGVPILTLASDKTTTQIDLPWIFRLGPTDAQQARAIAEDIYRRRGLHRVLLVTENDHDGRRGAAEIQDAAREFDAPSPTSLVLDSSGASADSFEEAVRAQNPEVIVLWTRACTARMLIQALSATGKPTPIYLPQEAAQEIMGASPHGDLSGERAGQAAIWTVASDSSAAAHEDFAKRFREARGGPPNAVAAEAYDAVLMIAQALRDAGPNRARVRDRIAGVKNWPGTSGEISFDREGNNLTRVRLVRLP